jgi:hypothetical protein
MREGKLLIAMAIAFEAGVLTVEKEANNTGLRRAFACFADYPAAGQQNVPKKAERRFRR